MLKTTKIERIPIIERGDLKIDPQCRIVELAGEEIVLYPKEFDVLYFLSQYPGWVLTSEQIYEAVWHEEGSNCNYEVYNTIYQLKKKLGSPGLIKTVRKCGYKFMG